MQHLYIGIGEKIYFRSVHLIKGQIKDMSDKTINDLFHNIKSSLATLKVANIGIREFFPTLLDGYTKAVTNNLVENEMFDTKHIHLLNEVLGNMEVSVRSISENIENLQFEIKSSRSNDESK